MTIKINGKEAGMNELIALLQQIDPARYEEIIRSMFFADPEATVRAVSEALSTLKSERKPSDPNTNH